MDPSTEPSNEVKLEAALILARSILDGKQVRIPIEVQLRGLAHTVIYLDDLRRGKN